MSTNENGSKGDDENMLAKLQEIILASENRQKDHLTKTLEPLKQQLEKNTNAITVNTISIQKVNVSTAENSAELLHAELC